MTFDLVMFINAKEVGQESTAGVHRLPLIRCLARHMPSSGKILVVTHYVSPISSRMPKSRIQRLDKNLFRYTPLIFGKLSLCPRIPLLRPFIRKQLRSQIAHVLESLGFNVAHPRAAWLSHPSHVACIGLMDETMSVYDCYDHFSLFGKEKIDAATLKNEESLARKADLILAGSHALRDRLRRFNDEIHLFNAAVDRRSSLFASGAAVPVAAEMVSIKRPIVGFCGCLKASDDLGLLRKVVERRPQWSFVFVGEIEGRVRKDFASLRALGNVHYLGFKKQDRITSFIRAFDAAIMPFKVCELTHTFTPYKMYDYIGAGVPIVSTPIREILRFRDVLRIGEDEESFIAAIESAFRMGREHLLKRYAQIIGAENWDMRAKFALGLIFKFMRKKGQT